MYLISTPFTNVVAPLMHTNLRQLFYSRSASNQVNSIKHTSYLIGDVAIVSMYEGRPQSKFPTRPTDSKPFIA